MLLFVALVCVIVALLLRYLHNKRQLWRQLGVVTPKANILFGHIGDFYLRRKNVSLTYKDFYDKYRDERFIGVYQVVIPDLILTDLDDIQRVLVSDFSHFTDRFDLVFEEREMMMNNLFNASGDRWKRTRQTVSPTFTTGKLKNMIPLILDVGNEFTKHLENIYSSGGEAEFRDLMAKFTTDVIGSCGFGINTNTMHDDKAPFRVFGRSIFTMNFVKIIKVLLKLFAPSLYSMMDLKVHGHEVEEFFLKVVQDIIDERTRTGIKRNDFIDLMLEMKHRQEENPNQEDAIKIDVKFIVAQAIIFFAAGFETSSTLMSHVLYELALHPDIQDKVYEDIRCVLDAHEGKLSYETISGMTYLDMVVSEAQRKYPALGILMRMCTHRYTFPGSNVTVEPKTMVSTPVYAIHHDPKYYPDPEKFIPERFSWEEKKRHPMMYLPFGDGPRNCVGLRLGKMQSMIGLITVLKDFSVEPCSKTVPKIIIDPVSFVMTNKEGVWLKLKRRNVVEK